MRKEKIVIVSDSVYPYFKGGKERRLYELSRRLVRESREVHIYTMQWWKGPTFMQHEGVYFHALCKLHPLYHNGRRSIAEALWFSLSVFKLLFIRFDILDVDHMPFFPLFSARIVTWLRGKRLYATWHEVWGPAYWKEYLHGPAGILGHFIENLSFMMPDVIISNSLHTTRKLHAAGVRCKVQTVSLGADLQSIYAAKPAEMKSDVIYVGRLLNHKGVDLLVHALEIVKETHPKINLLVVGTGPEKTQINSLISTLGLRENITLLDEIGGNDALYGLMKSSKMLVLPSLREGFGLVVIEANAAGIPVITTRHSDNAARDLVVEGVNGLLAEPTAEAIAATIEELMRSGAQMQPKRGIEKYDWSIVLQDLEKAFASV